MPVEEINIKAKGVCQMACSLTCYDGSINREVTNMCVTRHSHAHPASYVVVHAGGENDVFIRELIGTFMESNFCTPGPTVVFLNNVCCCFLFWPLLRTSRLL